MSRFSNREPSAYDEVLSTFKPFIRTSPSTTMVLYDETFAAQQLQSLLVNPPRKRWRRFNDDVPIVVYQHALDSGTFVHHNAVPCQANSCPLCVTREEP